MGIFSNLLKQAAVLGISAIPGVGAIAGPIAAGIAGASGGGGLKGAAQSVAGHVGGGLFKGGGDAGVASAEATGNRVADSVAGGISPGAVPAGSQGFFSGGLSMAEQNLSPQTVARNPIGMMAYNQVLTGKELLEDQYKALGLF